MRAERCSRALNLSLSTIRQRSFRSGPRRALVCAHSKLRNELCANTTIVMTRRMTSRMTRSCSQQPSKERVQESMACSQASNACGSTPAPNTRAFWSSSDCWGRASLNTTRCLVGCSLGDLSCMYLLQHYAPELGVPLAVAVSCCAGISTSLALETVALRITEGFAWRRAASTAASMSLVSMLAMELAENSVELSCGAFAADASSATFWLALPPALLAGFLSPLPYNYYMLRRYGRACH